MHDAFGQLIGISAGALNQEDTRRVSDLADRLERPTSEVGVEVTYGEHGLSVRAVPGTRRLAKITHTEPGTASPHTYSWVDVRKDPEDPRYYQEVGGGLWGTYYEGGAGAAVERNGDANVPVGSIVELELYGHVWLFDYRGPGTSDGGVYVFNNITQTFTTSTFTYNNSTVTYNNTTVNYTNTTVNYTTVNQYITNSDIYVQGDTVYHFGGDPPGTATYISLEWTTNQTWYVASNTTMTFAGGSNSVFTVTVPTLNINSPVINVGLSSTFTVNGIFVLCGDWEWCMTTTPAITTNQNPLDLTAITTLSPQINIPFNSAINVYSIKRRRDGQRWSITNTGSATVKLYNMYSSATVAREKVAIPGLAVDQYILWAPGESLVFQDYPALSYAILEGGTAYPPEAQPSGSNAYGGTIPTPGTSAGTTKFLREDMTWQVPSGGGTASDEEWEQIELDYTDFATGSTTNTITLRPLGSHEVVEDIIAKPRVAFGGGTIASYHFSIGVTGSNTRYLSALSLNGITATNTNFASSRGDGVGGITNVPDKQSFAGDTMTITATVSGAGATLNSANAGIIDVWVRISTLPT